MTAFAMPKYFSDLHFYSYFLNCLGDIHYKLPGLFLKNPLPSKVNGQLWTVPYELECYIALAVLGIIGLTHRPKLFLLMVASLILYGVLNYLRGQDRISEAFAGHQLVLCFLIGVLFYIFREKIPYDRRLGLAAIAVSMICFWIPGGFSLAPLPIAYTTVFLGLTQPHRLALIESGDYSYGIFLYGFPIQQAVVATRLVPLNGWTDLLTALPFVLLFAILSWHFWEKPMLHLRRFRPAIDRIFQFSAPGAVVARVASLAQPANPD
jgi:peptidoglycan/LPS O-acetylase OafA/YrhL